jgi:hypothetical protein
VAATQRGREPGSHEMAPRQRVRSVVLSCLLVTVTHCTPRQTPAPLLTKLSAPVPIKTQLATPSWVARFSNATELTDCLETERSWRLCVGALGERWLEGPGETLASPYLAPETLVAAMGTDSKSWIFVGQHGNRFVADSPLGPFTATRVSPRQYLRYAASAGHWFGLTDAGELWRGTDADLVGARVAVPDRILDFAMSRDGNGVAVGIPERIWLTRSFGSSWEDLKAGPFGTRSVSVDDQGGLSLKTLLFQPDMTVEGVRIRTRGAATAPFKLRNAPATFMQTEGFVEGRTAQQPHEFVEIRRIDERWQVARGALDRPLQFTKTKGLEGCADLRFAMSSQASLAICRHAADNCAALTLLIADSGALDFKKLPVTVSGCFSEVRIAPVIANRFIATGLCAPPKSLSAAMRDNYPLVKAEPRCRPKSPIIIDLGRTLPGGTPALHSAVAGVAIVPPVVATSPDGSRAAFIASSGQSLPWLLYYSMDAGNTFKAVSIDELPVTSAPARPQAVSAVRERREIRSLRFADDRSLSLVLKADDVPVIINFDDRGSLVASAMPPPAVSRVDAVGSRILAVSLTERNVYESMDRGASFELVDHLPAAACLTSRSCPVVCTSSGCLIGERFTRVSWGGHGSRPLDVTGAAGIPEFEPPTDRVNFRTALVCQAHAKGVVSGLTQAPVPELTSLSNWLWIGPWQNWQNGSAGAYRASYGSTRVETTTALPPIAHAEQAGLAVNFDDAGLAFLRSKNVPKTGEPFGELELAWTTYKLATWYHARFRDAAPSQSRDSYLLGANKARRLLPAQLAVSESGVLVQPHADSGQPLGATFVTQGASRNVPRITWPFERVRDQRLAASTGAWLAFAFDESGSVLLRARTAADDGAWEFSAQTVAGPCAQYFGGTHPYLVLGTAARGRPLQSLDAYPMPVHGRALDAPLHLPLPASLDEPPPACTARDRRELTRLLVPLLPAAAHAVGYRDSKDQMHWLVANQAVMYASRARACVDALWAETLPGMTPIHAVVPLQDSQHAWIFVTKRANGESKVDATPVSCRFDASANPPPEFETRTQARYNLDHLPLRN